MSELFQDFHLSVLVNGLMHRRIVGSDRLLIDFVRDDLGLTGAKVGCDTGQCGTCTVLVNGISVKSCAMLAAQADGCQVTTIEGLAQMASHRCKKRFGKNTAYSVASALPDWCFP